MEFALLAGSRLLSRLFICSLVFLCGCSGLLYHPSRLLHFDPKHLKLTPEEVRFKDSLDHSLFGWYFTHKGSSPSKGQIIVFHGNGENISTHYLNFIWLLENDYDFFIFDYSGYGRSEGEPSPEVTVANGVAAIKWLSQKVGGKPIVVYGQSLGGAVALRSVLELKNQIPIELIVADSTFESYKSAGASVMAKHWLTWLLQPFSYLVLSDSYTAKGRLCELAPTPVLVIHGTTDQIIDFDLGENVFNHSCQPKEFWAIDGGYHIDVFSNPKHGEKYRKLFLERLSKK